MIIKSIIIIILAVSFGFSSFYEKRPKKGTIEIIFFKDIIFRPVGISKEEFWSYRNSFDSIEIISQSLANRFKERINVFELAEEIEMDHRVAFIHRNEYDKPDTLYADNFLIQWNKSGLIYNDTAGYFRTVLHPLITTK